MRNPFARRPLPFERQPGAEVHDELAFHLEERVAEYVRQGMSPAAARARAMERFGDVGRVEGECTRLLEEERRTAGRRDWLAALAQDLRYGVRSALRAPLFTLLAVATLALGIGANAAVFGVVKSALLDALPYRDADRLVRVYQRMLDGTLERSALSAGTIADMRARQRSFAELAAFISFVDEASFAERGTPAVVNRAWVEPGLFRVLGVGAARGRLFREEDAAHDTVPVVVLSHGAWQRLLGGADDAVGRTVRVNDIPREVVGVLPRAFVSPVGGEEADVYFPLSLRPRLADPIGVRRSHNFGMVGRLRPGVTPGAASAEITAIAKALATEYPQDNGTFSSYGMPLRDALVGDARTPLLFLLASAGLVLLITCANLAGALLSRTLSRRREFAVRVALGAGRGRLARQLLTESVLLAAVGGLVGLLLASLALAGMRGLAGSALPSWVDLRLDAGAVAIAGTVALLTGVAFGLAPAISVGRADPQGTLREESRGASEGRRAQRVRGLLVAGQIALCVSLLMGAALLSRTLWAVATAPLGFVPDHVLTAGLQVPGGRYHEPAVRVAMYQQVLARVGAIPGVRGVAISSAVPTRVGSSNGLTIEGRPRAADGLQAFVPYQTVSDDYFRTMGIALEEGRTFGARDHADAPGAIVISRTMARQHWPDGGAIGARIRLGPDDNAPWLTVIGIVGDVRADVAKAEPAPITYATVRQNPWYSAGLLVRTAGDPMAYVRPVQLAVQGVDAMVPTYRAQSLAALLDEGMSRRRLPAALMLAFGALALLLASVGVYAMFASLAASREREFGIRVALGSSPRRVAGLVVRQGAVWMALGLAGGAAGIVVVTRLLGEMLYGVARFDPLALAAAVLLLVLCAALALLGPVRRATRVDPISVLR